MVKTIWIHSCSRLNSFPDRILSCSYLETVISCFQKSFKTKFKLTRTFQLHWTPYIDHKSQGQWYCVPISLHTIAVRFKASMALDVSNSDSKASNSHAIVQAVSSRFPSAAARVRSRVRTEWHWGRFSPKTSVSSANLHSTNYFIRIIIMRGWYNRPISRRRTKWTCHPNPTPRIKKRLRIPQRREHARVFPCCVVLWPCDGDDPLPASPKSWVKGLAISKVKSGLEKGNMIAEDENIKAGI
jgi:hypothetical protein